MTQLKDCFQSRSGPYSSDSTVRRPDHNRRPLVPCFREARGCCALVPGSVFLFHDFKLSILLDACLGGNPSLQARSQP